MTDHQKLRPAVSNFASLVSLKTRNSELGTRNPELESTLSYRLPSYPTVAAAIIIEIAISIAPITIPSAVF